MGGERVGGEMISSDMLSGMVWCNGSVIGDGEERGCADEGMGVLQPQDLPCWRWEILRWHWEKGDRLQQRDYLLLGLRWIDYLPGSFPTGGPTEPTSSFMLWQSSKATPQLYQGTLLTKVGPCSLLKKCHLKSQLK